MLYKLHPIFKDIRSIDEQIRFEVTNTTWPADGDMSRFNADINIQVGDIALDTGSQLLRVMRLTSASEREMLEGHISDLNVKIRRGNVTYTDFVVSIDKRRNSDEYRHRLVFSGDIDLVKNHVNSVVAGYPIEDLANSIKELQNIPGISTIGVEFSGDLYDDQGNPRDLDMDLAVGGLGNDAVGNPLDAIGKTLNELLNSGNEDDGADGRRDLTEEELREQRRRNREERRQQEQRGGGDGGDLAS